MEHYRTESGNLQECQYTLEKEKHPWLIEYISELCNNMRLHI